MPEWLSYIDPGTGTLLFQLLIAGVVSALLFFTNLFRRVRHVCGIVLSWVGLRQRPADPAAEVPAPEGSDPLRKTR